MVDLKNEIPENDMEELDLADKKRRNDFNKFLNLYFRYIAVFVVIVLMWVAIRFLIQPRFNEAVISSNVTLKEKKTEFLNEYNKMEKYRSVISQFSKIDKASIEKINKMIPEKYSRDDLFTEVTYFLIKNNFKIENINISNPGESEEAVASSSVPTRRATGDDKKTTPAYSDYIKTLDPEIGYWLVTLNLNEVNYTSLKYLLSILENNLKLVDIFSVDFQPANKTVSIQFLTYYKK